MERKRFITVSYLAKIAGMKEETVRRNVKELRAILEREPRRSLFMSDKAKTNSTIT
jgi:hypothetical protein